MDRNDILLTPDEWSILAGVNEILKPFDEVTTDLSSQFYSSLSKVIPLIKFLQPNLRAMHIDMPVAQFWPFSKWMKWLMWPRKVGLSILFLLFSILGNKNISSRILLTILKLSNTFKKNWIYLLGDCWEKSWKGVETSHYPYPAKMLQFPRFPLAYFQPSNASNSSSKCLQIFPRLHYRASKCHKIWIGSWRNYFLHRQY